jgi:hypothetical protein
MSYTAETLAAFMATKLGRTGVALGLTDVSDALVEAVADVAAVLGVSDIADLTDDLKTRTVAEWQAWRAAKGAAAGQYDLKAGTSSLTRSQFFDHIAAMLADAETAAMRYSEVAAILAGSSTGYVSGMNTAGSPYAYPVCTEW